MYRALLCRRATTATATTDKIERSSERILACSTPVRCSNLASSISRISRSSPSHPASISSQRNACLTSFRTLRRTIRSSRSSDISLPREQQPRAASPQRLSNACFICAIILWRRMSSAAASGPVAA